KGMIAMYLFLFRYLNRMSSGFTNPSYCRNHPGKGRAVSCCICSLPHIVANIADSSANGQHTMRFSRTYSGANQSAQNWVASSQTTADQVSGLFEVSISIWSNRWIG